MAYPNPCATQQKTGGQQHDDSHSAAAAVVQQAKRENNYVPFQESRWYNGDYGSNQDSDGPHEDRLNGKPVDYRYTTETVRRRKYGRPTRDPYTLEERSYRYPSLRKPKDADDGEYDYERGRAKIDAYDAATRRYDDRDYSPDYDEGMPRQNRSRGRRRDRSNSPSLSRSRDHHSRSSSTSNPPPYRPPQIQPQDDPQRPPEKYSLLKAAKSAAMAGGVEAVRCRYEPGPWNGQKAQRVALAAAVGVVIGSLRNGRLQNSGKKPYAEAAMTGMYAIDFMRRVARHTEFDKDAKAEQRGWREDAARKARDERRSERGSSRSRHRDYG